MFLATDVQYLGDTGFAAGVAFSGWEAPVPEAQYVVRCPDVAPYEPGNFYRRELPCLMRLLDAVRVSVDCILVDGFVFLDGVLRPGLGKHLFDALDGRVPVVGVAKSAFTGISGDCAVLRGGSQRPLYVTSIGMSGADARAGVGAMHGEYRLPALLKGVDQLCRAEAKRFETACATRDGAGSGACRY